MKINLVAIFVLIAIFVNVPACAPFRETRDTLLYLENLDQGVFENKLVKATVLPVTALYEHTGEDAGMIEKLFDKSFIILRFSIENTSKFDIVYNPSHTALMAGAMDYKKPLDYTDLYLIAREADKEGLPDAEIKKIKGKFYDLNTTVHPGEKIEKLLLFRPLDKDTKGLRAALMINELYVGTDTLAIAFQFNVKEIRKNHPQ